MMKHQQKIPTLIKWLFTLFMAILVPIYWISYGPSNFLWNSDIVLILAYLATIFESRTLASMASVGGFVFFSLWTLAFLITLVSLLFGGDLILVDYMFNPEHSLWLRGLSLFHGVLPFLMLWLLHRLRFDRRAWIYQVGITWAAAFASWLWTDPEKNVNFVFSYERFNLEPIPYLILGSCAMSLIIFATHLLFKRMYVN